MRKENKTKGDGKLQKVPNHCSGDVVTIGYGNNVDVAMEVLHRERLEGPKLMVEFNITVKLQ